jgi:hypothetical protein
VAANRKSKKNNKPAKPWQLDDSVHPDVLERLPPPPLGQRQPGRDKYPEIVRRIAADLKLDYRLVDDNYGSGTASFIDVWFYRDTDDFRRPPGRNKEFRYTGVYCIINLDAPYFAMGEGEKSWGPTTGSFYLPRFSSIDDFATLAVRELAQKIDRQMRLRGLVRLSQAELAPELPDLDASMSCIVEGPARIFDELFFWYD